MNIGYKVLFSIEILNDYFSFGKWKEVSFIPLPETRKLIDANGPQIRQIQNQLLVITRVDKEFDNLNVNVNAGKSINAIRPFIGKGTLVFGARTLAGNDNE